MSFLPLRQPDDQSPRFLGIDLAKRESQLSVLNSEGLQIISKRFATTRSNIIALSSELTVTDTVALEVTTNSNAITRLLQQSKAVIITSNPLRTRVIAQAKIKTDKIDARVLAELARVDYLPRVWLPDPGTEALRHLFCDRRSLVDRRTELKNTVHSILHRNLIEYQFSDLFGNVGRRWLTQLCDSDDGSCDALDRLRLGAILAEVERLDLAVNEIEGVIAAFISERSDLRSRLDHLLSIPGVSLVVGAGLLAAIGDVTRFGRAKQLAAYFGLVPSTYQSGDTAARHGRITKTGRSDARWLAVEAAEHLRKAPGPLRALYQRVCQKRGHNVAVVAVARKLAELCYHLLTKDEDYLYNVPRLTLEKRARVRLLAKQRTKRKVKSAATRVPRPVLYGSGLQGRRVTAQIARAASEQAEAVYRAIVCERKEGHQSNEIVERAGFDPTRPQAVDWQRVLEHVASRIAKTLPPKPEVVPEE